MDPNRVIFGNWAIKRPANQPNGRLPENRRHPKYLIIWGSDDPIEFGPYELKIRGLHRFSIKNADFLAKKILFLWPKIHVFLEITQIFCYHHGGIPKDNILVLTLLHGRPRGGR